MSLEQDDDEEEDDDDEVREEEDRDRPKCASMRAMCSRMHAKRAPMARSQRRKKVLKPPGRAAEAKAKAASKPKPARSKAEDEEEEYVMDEDEDEEEDKGDDDDDDDGGQKKKKSAQQKKKEAAALAAAAAAAAYEAPSLRRSTQQKTAEAEETRMWREQVGVSGLVVHQVRKGPRSCIPESASIPHCAVLLCSREADAFCRFPGTFSQHGRLKKFV